jgi:zinc/manganese transport system substrate-binding protein
MSARRTLTRKPRKGVAISALGLLATGALTLTACGSSDASAKGGDSVKVVATTDVYGSVAKAVGGDHVDVTSIIHSASQDPHSYESSPRDKLAFSKADVVITNGGGYDQFATDLLKSLNNEPTVLTAVDSDHAFLEETGKKDHEDDADEHAHNGHEHGEANEHVWYNVHTMKHVTEHLAADLAKADPDNKSDYQANAKKYEAQLSALEDDVTELKAKAEGTEYMMTEPVPKALLEGAGLTDATPEGLSEAVEEGDEIPAALLNDGLKELKQGKVALFAYNAQTADDQTEKLRDAAKSAGIPVINFTETLPKNKDYVEWMASNIGAVQDALSK